MWVVLGGRKLQPHVASAGVIHSAREEMGVSWEVQEGFSHIPGTSLLLHMVSLSPRS